MGQISEILGGLVSDVKELVKECRDYLPNKKVSDYKNTEGASYTVFDYLKKLGAYLTQKRKNEYDVKPLDFNGFRPTSNFNDDVVIGAPPILDKPTNVFKLCFLVDLLLQRNEERSYLSAKTEVSTLDETTKSYNRQKIANLNQALKLEKQAYRWGILQKSVTWLASLSGIMMGAALVATGVGAVAGSILIAAGVISITMSLMDLFGVWDKITDKLPGDDPAKKRTVMMWIQLGISVFCLAICAVGVIFNGDFSSLKESLGTAMQVLGGIIGIAGGVGTIGKGLSESKFKRKLADSKFNEKQVQELEIQREDLTDELHDIVENIEGLFKRITQIFQLYQKVINIQLGR